jgi:two-component system alkaline phosphatase synthesis response regulator PhoP
MAEKILIVEDERNIASFVSMYLKNARYQVEIARDGGEALMKAENTKPDLVVLDLMLPDIDGLEVGADDYLTKPFNPRELVARIKSILRRSTATAKGGRPAEAVMEHGDLKIDAGRREVTVSGEHVQLAPKEFDLLWELLDHRGLVLTRDQLLERVWGYTFAGDTRTVDVHVRQLRRKLGDACPVATVWGVGYKVADDATVASN